MFMRLPAPLGAFIVGLVTLAADRVIQPGVNGSI